MWICLIVHRLKSNTFRNFVRNFVSPSNWVSKITKRSNFCRYIVGYLVTKQVLQSSSYQNASIFRKKNKKKRKVTNQYIRKKDVITPMVTKMVETHLKWFVWVEKFFRNCNKESKSNRGYIKSRKRPNKNCKRNH